MSIWGSHSIHTPCLDLNSQQTKDDYMIVMQCLFQLIAFTECIITSLLVEPDTQCTPAIITYIVIIMQYNSCGPKAHQYTAFTVLSACKGRSYPTAAMLLPHQHVQHLSEEVITIMFSKEKVDKLDTSEKSSWTSTISCLSPRQSQGANNHIDARSSNSWIIRPVNARVLAMLG